MVVNLTGPWITQETHLWACLWFLDSVNWARKTSLNCEQCHYKGFDPSMNKKESMSWAPICLLSGCTWGVTSLTFLLPCHDGPTCKPKAKQLLPLVALHGNFCHSNDCSPQTKWTKTLLVGISSGNEFFFHLLFLLGSYKIRRGKCLEMSTSSLTRALGICLCCYLVSLQPCFTWIGQHGWAKSESGKPNQKQLLDPSVRESMHDFMAMTLWTASEPPRSKLISDYDPKRTMALGRWRVPHRQLASLCSICHQIIFTDDK